MTRKLIAAPGFLLLTCCATLAQINPKITPKITPQQQVPKTVITNVPIIKNIVFTGILTPFYIEQEGFWVTDTRDGTVKIDPCVANDNRYRWTSTNNPDGTVTITSQSDDRRKLVYKNLQIMFQGRMQGQKGYYAEAPPGSTSGMGNRYINKWYLRAISGQDYWITSSDRADSVRVSIVPVADIPFNTISFNLGTLEGWSMIAGSSPVNAFAGQPSAINYIPFYDSPVVPAMPLGGDYWKDFETRFFSADTKTNGNYINTARPGTNRYIRPDESRTGSLVSAPFFICMEGMNFRIAGTNDVANTRFELLQRIPAGTPGGTVSFPDGMYRVVPNSVTTGHNNDVTRKVVINVKDLKYSICRIRIVDNSTTGHIDVDEIAFGDAPREGLVSGGSDPIPPTPVPPTPNKPIWGAVDMHTHPMSYLGMGGKLMYGTLDGDPRIALANCNDMHGGWGTDNTGGNYIRAMVVNEIDHEYDKRYEHDFPAVPHQDHPHEGYPALVNWPVQSSMTHQQMWFEWIRRAKEGGLKAIIALTVNSELLGRVLDGAPPYDDKTVADRQIDELIAFVRRHNDFMDTVTTAARMRQVVNQNKMAVIIGMEIDNIGNFYRNVPVSIAQIKAEIQRLKDKGVRYIFPIHVIDNKFGGSAVYQELFNYSNKYASGQPITGTVPPQAYPPVLPGTLFQVEPSPDPRVAFRYESGSASLRIHARVLLEAVEAGGLPPVSPEVLAIKPVVDPVLVALLHSTQFQLLKRIYLDVHPEAAAYDRIRVSATVAGGHQNVYGLSAEGKFAIREMMRQGIMIDIDHASQKSVSDMLVIAKQFDYPVNSGHNGMREAGTNEKTRTAGEVDTIRSVGGMFGLGWEDNTAGGFYTLLGGVNGLMGNRNIAVGSDIDGYAATPKKPLNSSQFINYTDRSKPDFLVQYSMPGSRSWNYNTEGMSHYGLVPDFFQAMKSAGAESSVLNSFFLGAEYFAEMWEKCEVRSKVIPRE